MRGINGRLRYQAIRVTNVFDIGNIRSLLYMFAEIVFLFSNKNKKVINANIML